MVQYSVTAATVVSSGAAAALALAGKVTGDSNDRIEIREDGKINWGPGNGAVDTDLYRSAAGSLTTDGFFAMSSGQASGQFTSFTGAAKALVCGTAGGGLAIAEGANARMGVSTLVAGTVVVANTGITASTRIQLTIQSLGTVTAPKAIGVTARSVGTSFTITSADATDTSVIAWELKEPA